MREKNNILEGMEKFIRLRPGRKTKQWLSISKSGWATITDGLRDILHADNYRSVDLFIKPNDKKRNIGFVLYTDEDEGELLLRARKASPNPVGCGFCVIRLVRHKPEYIGYYEVKDIQEEHNKITVLLKPIEQRYV